MHGGARLWSDAQGVKVDEDATRWIRHAWDIEGWKLHAT